MSVKVLWTKGRAAPVIGCDVCGEIVEDVHLAMYAFEQAEAQDGTRSSVSFVHKGRCWTTVNERFKRIGDVELSALLDYLRHNLELDMKESAETAHVGGAEDCSYENPDRQPEDELTLD